MAEVVIYHIKICRNPILSLVIPLSYFCDKAIFLLSFQLEIIICLFVNTNICFICDSKPLLQKTKTVISIKSNTNARNIPLQCIYI